VQGGKKSLNLLPIAAEIIEELIEEIDHIIGVRIGKSAVVDFTCHVLKKSLNLSRSDQGRMIKNRSLSIGTSTGTTIVVAIKAENKDWIVSGARRLRIAPAIFGTAILQHYLKLLRIQK